MSDKPASFWKYLFHVIVAVANGAFVLTLCISAFTHDVLAARPAGPISADTVAFGLIVFSLNAVSAWCAALASARHNQTGER